jgi:hypothetical protein
MLQKNQTTEKLHFDSTVVCQQELLQLRLHLFLLWQNRGDSLAGVVFGQAFLHENFVHHHRLQIHQKSQSKIQTKQQFGSSCSGDLHFIKKCVSTGYYPEINHSNMHLCQMDSPFQTTDIARTHLN